MIKIALAGNPNVGKSTIFNNLTGLKQHTGNWPGKTVGNAIGEYRYNHKDYIIYDLPGTYSLNSNSKEETIARDFILSNVSDITVIVVDATSLERNLNLVLQIMEMTCNVILCLNLMDEAKKKGITIDKDKLSKLLDIPVVETSATNNIGIDKLMEVIEFYSINKQDKYLDIKYSNVIEDNIKDIKKYIDSLDIDINSRWLSIKLLCNDIDILKLDIDIDKEYLKRLADNSKNNIKDIDIQGEIIKTIVRECEDISKNVIRYKDKNYYHKNNKIDKILTNKITGIPIMLLSLFFILWLTIIGSNYPSDLLYNLFSSWEDSLFKILSFLPSSISNCLVYGVYRTVYWVISVMLPPMAIFFPLFTVLEDFGYLPRIAFNLDKCFHKCKTCGKQSLTMCMGFGCNAVGVTGCRIISSYKERLIAIITNVFMPCNGRFPMLIALISMFLVNNNGGVISSLLIALYLVLIILLGIVMTFIVSRIVAKCLHLKESSFVLELPSYRKPKIISVIVRSILDRTIFVLGRAITISIPAGIIIYVLANNYIGDNNVITILSNVLNPIGILIGLDGVILLSFILGFPANEIVIPIMLMAYTSNGVIANYESIDTLKNIFIDNGWTVLTCICTIMFTIIHFPCSTTVLTIYKETKSKKWTILSILIPTLCGFILCLVVSIIYRIIL